MTDQPRVALSAATEVDAPVLANLLELYIHDLSPAFPDIALGSDGRFGYQHLPLYWSEPGRRFPFLIRAGAQVAGFALVTRGVLTSSDPDEFDVAEFFVMRRHRRSGVGREAATLLWQRLPGRWTVRVSEGNVKGLQFWAAVTAEFTGGTSLETTRPGLLHPWRVFSFSSEGRERRDEAT